MTKENIGKVLKNLRLNAGITPSEVTTRLKEYGINISDKTLYGYENGHSAPQINTLFRLCEVYGVDDVAAAFGFENSKSPTIGNDDGALEHEKLFKSLSPAAQRQALDYIRFLSEKETEAQNK